MLSSAAGVALLGGAAAYSGHHAADIPDLLARIALLMVGSGLIGAYFLFRPLSRYLAAPAHAPPPVTLIQRLPILSGGWVLVLAAATVGGNLGASHGPWRAIARADPSMLATMFAHVLAFASYIALYVYFLIRDYVADLRQQLWLSRGILLPAGKGRIAVEVFVGIAAVAAAPALLLFSDQSSAPPAMDADAEMHHALLAQALSLDLLAAVLFTVALVVLIARGILRPITALVEGMERVDRGELKTKVAILSDNELGMLAARFNRMLEGLAERESMRRVFGRFVPEQVAGALLAERGAIEPQEREASVLFTDIERFTEIAAGHEPREVLSLLNDYFEHVARIIDRQGGVITQFQGDAVLAVFNLPASAPDYAWRAVQAALDIADSSPLRTRVGVSTGRVVGGTVGGGDRLGYTVHGATVNLAARLEEMNKQQGTSVLIDRRTAELIGGQVAVRERGAMQVRGLPQPVDVFEPLHATQ